MTRKGWNRSENLLKEGRSYMFKIRKLIRLSDDNNYFILEDPFGKKHLMFDKFYIHYGMKSGDSIKCKVDRINCNGKIYLEPRHPYYKVSGVYEFEITGVTELENSKGRKETLLQVNDKYKSNAVILDRLPSSYKMFVSLKIRAKVKRIKKAILYIGVVDQL